MILLAVFKEEILFAFEVGVSNTAKPCFHSFAVLVRMSWRIQIVLPRLVRCEPPGAWTQCSTLVYWSMSRNSGKKLYTPRPTLMCQVVGVTTVIRGFAAWALRIDKLATSAVVQPVCSMAVADPGGWAPGPAWRIWDSSDACRKLTTCNSVAFAQSSPMCLEELCVSAAVGEEVATLTTKNSTTKM